MKASNVKKDKPTAFNKNQQGSKYVAGRDRRHTGSGTNALHTLPDAKAKPWIKGSKLVTTRMSHVNHEKERQQAQSDKYLQAVEAEADYPSTVS